MSWHRLFLAPWLLFAAWWLVRAFGAAPAERKESLGSRLSHVALLVAGGVLLAMHFHGLLGHRWWRPSRTLAWACFGIEVLGLAFAIWARETLGRLWSGTVTLKQDHRVVRTGPYRLARHPIYTGILVALAAIVLVRADLSSLGGFVLIALGIARKIAIEETLLTGHFGDEYRAYRREVRAIIPFIL